MSKGIRKSILSLALLSGVALSSHAQDVHFTQFYNTPLFQNVANTGLMSNSDFRATAIYRSQWASIPAPFTTYAAAAEFQTLRNDQFTNWMGVSAYFLNDVAGDGSLALTQLGTSVAYHILLDESNLLSFGLGFSANTRKIDFDKFSYDAQWDGFTFNRTRANGEINSFEKGNYLNISAGINYSFLPSEQLYFKIGAGVTNINRPKISFLGNSDNLLPMRSIATADAIIAMDNGWRLAPSAYFSYMTKAQETMVGLLVGKDLESSLDKMTGQIFWGAHYRVNESVIATVGIEWAQTRLTLSYDVTVSELNKANRGNGAFELSLVYQGLYKNSPHGGKSPFECPRF